MKEEKRAPASPSSLDEIKKLMNAFYGRARQHIVAESTSSGKSQYDAKEVLDVVKRVAVEMVTSEEGDDDDEEEEEEKEDEDADEEEEKKEEMEKDEAEKSTNNEEQVTWSSGNDGGDS